MKRIWLLGICLMLWGMGTAWAADGQIAAGGSGFQLGMSGKQMPKMIVLYVNNAKAAYNNEVDAKINEHIQSLAKNRWEMVPGDSVKGKLNGMGIESILMAERADILAAAKDVDADALLLIEVEPFVIRDLVTFFTVGKKVTASMPVKMVDLHSGMYLYNGKFVEMGQDNTMVGMIGNKSVSMKALDMIFEKFDPMVLEKIGKVKLMEKTEKVAEQGKPLN